MTSDAGVSVLSGVSQQRGTGSGEASEGGGELHVGWGWDQCVGYHGREGGGNA